MILLITLLGLTITDHQETHKGFKTLDGINSNQNNWTDQTGRHQFPLCKEDG
jgi:hypothetical protein